MRAHDMAKLDCTSFLQDVLPRIGYRWRGFKNVRGQVCKRVTARFRELGLQGFDDYHRYLMQHAEEWAALDGLCRVTISRFYRDRGVFNLLRDELLPALARQALREGRGEVACASLGCASGEEAYTVRAIWLTAIAPLLPGMDLSVLGLDVDAQVLARAERGLYDVGSFREMPEELLSRCVARTADRVHINDEVRRKVLFLRGDLREWQGQQHFDLVLCRNLAFTYFDEPTQVRIAAQMAEVTVPGGYLVLGAHEVLPEGCPAWQKVHATIPVFQRRAPGHAG
jgi:chemotaxis protein methyltransferase CheR